MRRPVPWRLLAVAAVLVSLGCALTLLLPHRCCVTEAALGRVKGRAEPGSGLPQHQIERPAAANVVEPRRPQVREERGVVAAGLFERVGEDGEAGRVEVAGG